VTTGVYLIHNSWSDANYKVGISSSPSRRSGQVCIEYDVDPTIITSAWFTSTDTARKAETFWHRYLQDFRTDDHPGKEWFSLSPKFVQMFCKWCELGKSRSELSRWLHIEGTTPKQRGDYDHTLIRQIPRHRHPPSIDVWTNNGLSDNSS